MSVGKYSGTRMSSSTLNRFPMLTARFLNENIRARASGYVLWRGILVLAIEIGSNMKLLEDMVLGPRTSERPVNDMRIGKKC